jgi:hypothetical protein
VSFSYDNAASDLGKVRLLIGDTQLTGHIFEDEEILNGFLSIHADVRLAAADALDVIASSTVLVQNVIKVLDLETNGDKVAAALREQATALRDRVDDDYSFDYAEMVLNSFGERDRIYKQFLRGVI